MNVNEERMKLYMADMERLREEGIVLHRKLNDIEIERLIVKYEHKLGLTIGVVNAPLHLRLDAVLMAAMEMLPGTVEN